MRFKINSIPKDPRTDELLETIQKLDSEIIDSSEEIKLLTKTAKTQGVTIKRKSDNPQIEERFEILKKELADTKMLIKEKEKEAKDIIFNNQIKVIIILYK